MKEVSLPKSFSEGTGIRTAVDTFILSPDSNRLILGKRRSRAGEDTWSLIGGHQTKGETIVETAAREIKEELGDEVIVDLHPRIIAVRENNIPPFHVQHLTIVIFGIYRSGEIKHQPEELTAVSWFDLENPPQPLFSGVEEIIEVFKHGEPSVVTDWYPKK